MSAAMHLAGRGTKAELSDLINLRHVAKRLTLMRNQIATNPMSGQLRSRRQGRGMDFSEVRIYQPGDDIRSIDWKVTARTSSTHTKVFQEERERPVLILLDQSESLYFGSRVRFKSVAAARLAATLGWTALDQGDRVGGIVFNHQGHRETRPRRSRKSLLRFIHDAIELNHQLAQPPEDGKRYPMSEMIAAAQRVSRHGCLVFIISDFQNADDELETRLSQLGQTNEIHGICIFDPLDKTLPPPGRYAITNGVDVQDINTANRSIQAEHTARFDRHNLFINRIFSRAGGRLTQVVAQAEPEEYLNNLMHRRGVS